MPSRERPRRVLMLDELQVIKLAVDAAPREQLVVAADLDDLALVQDHDLVRGSNCRQPVRDDEGRAAAHEIVESLLDEPLRLRIERGGRLIEYQNRRIL